jgi:hypothetical protein
MKKSFSIIALISMLHTLNVYADVTLQFYTPQETSVTLILNQKQILLKEDGYILYGTLVVEDESDAQVAFTLIQETSKGHKMTFDYAPEVLVYNKISKIKPNFKHHVVLKATRV